MAGAAGGTRMAGGAGSGAVRGTAGVVDAPAVVGVVAGGAAAVGAGLRWRAGGAGTVTTEEPGSGAPMTARWRVGVLPLVTQARSPAPTTAETAREASAASTATASAPRCRRRHMIVTAVPLARMMRTPYRTDSIRVITPRVARGPVIYAKSVRRA